MKSKDIMSMARAAQIVPPNVDVCPKHIAAIERFAKLIITATREECAQVCDNVSIDLMLNNAAGSDAANQCVEAIRLLNRVAP